MLSRLFRLLVFFCLCAQCLFLTGCDGNTELMKSVLSEDSAQVQALLDAGADINARNNYGWTALMHAARNGDPDQDDRGWTALMRAARMGHANIVEILIQQGADLEKSDNQGWTALLWAVNQEHLSVVDALANHGADVNVKAKDGRTPLMVAISEGNDEILERLKKAGAKF